jgi:hypothetical protein
MNDTPQKVKWLETWRPRYLFNPSSLVLLVVNLIPLLGILWDGWDFFVLLLLYWSETAIITFWTLPEFIWASGFLSVFYVPFFMAHISFFMWVYLRCLHDLYGMERWKSLHVLGDYWGQVFSGTYFLVAFAALFISHGITTFLSYRDWDPFEEPLRLMVAPYRRIFLMQAALLLMMVFAKALGSPKGGVVLLLVVKVFLDMAIHVRWNFKPLGPATATPDPGPP